MSDLAMSDLIAITLTAVVVIAFFAVGKALIDYWFKSKREYTNDMLNEASKYVKTKESEDDNG